GAVDLGVVPGPDAVAIPRPPRGLVQQPRGGALQGILVPGPVLDKALQRLPVPGPVGADQRLGDRVLLDVERQPGDPLGEAAEAPVTEGVGARLQQLLPVGPQFVSLHEAPPVSQRVQPLVTADSAARAVPYLSNGV